MLLLRRPRAAGRQRFLEFVERFTIRRGFLSALGFGFGFGWVAFFGECRHPSVFG